MIFGVFDGIHKGHAYFLRSAAAFGSLYAVVASDKAVEGLKGRKPLRDQQSRLDALRGLEYVTNALLGDELQGQYSAIKKIKPDIVCLGYDQNELATDLNSWLEERDDVRIEVVRIASHEPKKYKSSLL